MMTRTSEEHVIVLQEFRNVEFLFEPFLVTPKHVKLVKPSESQLSNMILKSVVVEAHCSSLLAVT